MLGDTGVQSDLSPRPLPKELQAAGDRQTWMDTPSLRGLGGPEEGTRTRRPEDMVSAQPRVVGEKALVLVRKVNGRTGCRRWACRT